MQFYIHIEGMLYYFKMITIILCLTIQKYFCDINNFQYLIQQHIYGISMIQPSGFLLDRDWDGGWELECSPDPLVYIGQTQSSLKTQLSETLLHQGLIPECFNIECIALRLIRLIFLLELHPLPHKQSFIDLRKYIKQEIKV